MRIVTAIALLLALSPLAHSADAVRPEGKNCALPSPPSEAGEEMNRGSLLRVYPRAKDIDGIYTGCQVLFAPRDGKWQVISLTEIVNGDPVRLWSEYEQDPAVLACRYKGGKVTVGDPDKCPMAEFLLVKSMAPGCVKLMQDTVAKGGVGAQTPRQCEYQ